MANHCIMANPGRNWRALSDKIVQVGTFGPKIKNMDGHNGPKINMMEAGIYEA